jgi:hypothetical protein
VKGYNEGSLNVVTILHTDRPSPFILLEELHQSELSSLQILNNKDTDGYHLISDLSIGSERHLRCNLTIHPNPISTQVTNR